uniref:C2H2-type domain-containing protein n=1 Tax=Anopheles farauti TaxID=69004 RepID=A0A182Q196_9DIPT
MPTLGHRRIVVIKSPSTAIGSVVATRNGGAHPNPYQPVSQHHTINLTNGLTISNGVPQGCSSGSSGSSNSTNNQLTIMLNPPVTPGQTYPIPLSPPGGEGRAVSPPVQNGGSGPVAAAAATAAAQAGSKFRCDQCNISFGSKSAHTSHMKSHAKHAQQQQQQQGGKANGDKTVEGSAAGGSLNSSPQQQQQQQPQPDPYQCDVCKKTFAVPARLVRHYRTHTGERPFECEFCHKMFSVKENLQVHRRIHTKERPYKCEICGRAFEHSGKLHRHMRIHTGERPHKCNVCGKTFIQSGQLVIHMRTHTGEKPYKCPVEGCGKGFTCSKQLKVHSRTHTGEKPYHCDICFRDFGYNHVLKLHRVQHYGAKCYKCTICDETFKSKKEMESHIKGHANELPDDEEGTGGTSEEAGCKVEDGSGASAALDGNSSSIGSNSNSSFEYTEANGAGLAAGAARSVRIEEEEMEEDDEEDAGDGEEEDEEHDRKQQILPYGAGGMFAYDGGVCTAAGGGVAPALLAAASIAAAVENGCGELKYDVKQQRTISPTLGQQDHQQQQQLQQEQHQQQQQQQSALSITRITPSPSSGSSSSSSTSSSTSSHSAHGPSLDSNATITASSGAAQFGYEPITSIMKHHGYFAPASQITEFRSSSDIVRQVEAAIAGTENLLTPPRSSPESPDRSSSPESDSVLLADRDNNTLPPRKRKLYFKDSQQQTVAPKLASLQCSTPATAVADASQHYSVMMLPEAHSGASHAHQQQLFVADHTPVWPADAQHQRPVKLESGASCRVQPPSSPTQAPQAPQAPPQAPTQSQPQASVIRMSSVIQYANKSS